MSEENKEKPAKKKTFFQRIKEKIPFIREITPIPTVLCFEHLYSEYSSLKYDDGKKFSAEEEKFIENLFLKRETTPPTWQELYRVELILAKRIPDENLRGKVKQLRFDFESIVGKQEFEHYMQSKPPELQSPPDRDKEPEKLPIYHEKLREDLKDLLDRIYLRYAILPIKEKKLNRLTAFSAGLCLLSLLLLLVIVVVLFLWDLSRNPKDIASLTILIVVVTGAMGGFVSALRRIQNQPSQGDSVYNLSLLFHGSHSVLVAPVSGAIFAILLYLMFTSQVLRGTFFPEIYTPRAQRSFQSGEMTSGSRSRRQPPPDSGESRATSPSNPQTNQNTNTQVENPQPNDTDDETVAANTTTGTAGTSTATPSPTKPPPTAPTPEPVAVDSLKIVDFLAKSGPAGGKDFALLILWSFIAGFAERFVPDALDRFIKRGDAAGGGKT